MISRTLRNCGRQLRFESLEDRRLLATLTVVNTFSTSVEVTPDSGSLSWAVDKANSVDGLDQILFNLSASEMAQGIEIINGPLLITDDVQIAGPSPTNQVKIFAGVGETRGFDFKIQVGTANQSQIRNLKISGFDEEAIHVDRLQSSDSLAIIDNTIEFNEDAIEIDPNGTVVQILVQGNTIQNNSSHGIYAHNGGLSGTILNIVDNTIIGNTAAGILYDTFDAPVDIRDNRIGITDTETAVPNGKGVWLLSSSSTAASNIGSIVGSGINSGNTISANTEFGILLQASEFPSLVIQQNNIGSNSAGGLISALGNGVGVSAQLGSTFGSISNNLISSNTEGITLFKNDGGVIAGNFVVLSEGDGIRIGELSDDVIVSGNFIGTDTIETPFGNSGAGISVTSNAGTGNAFLSNFFSSNEGLAIDLGQDGHTQNDDDDLDSGPNGLLNFPALSEQGITFSGSSWHIPYNVDVDAPGN